MKNPKAKGNAFELKIAKILSEWSGKKFHRTPASGALHWENDKRVISDIVPPQDLNWPLSIECKNVVYDWDFSLLIKETSTFWKHWKQATDDAKREGMIPMLVFTKNYRDTYVALLYKTFRQLNLGSEKVIYLADPNGGDFDETIVIMSLDNLLNNNTVEKILELYN